MSRKPTDAIRLSTLVVTRLTTWLKPRTVFLGEAGGDLDVVIESFQAWCAAHAGGVCELALSSRWVVSCVPPAAAGQLTARELRQYAQRQIDHYLPDARKPEGGRWAMAIAARSDLSLACSTPGELIERLKTVAVVYRVEIRRIFPWWLGPAWRSTEPMRKVVAAEPSITTVIQFEQGRLDRVTTDFDADPSEQDAVILWRGSEPMPVTCDIAAVADVIVARRLSRPGIPLDLLETPSHAWWGSWALLLFAVICALVEMHRQETVSLARGHEQAMFERSQASRVRVRQPIRAASLRAGLNVATDARALDAAADWVSLQQHPWADVFAGVEAASGHVAILSLQHDAQHPTVDVELAVPSDDAAWEVAERLAADTARFRSATLLTRQALDSPPGTLNGRVRVQAVLATAPLATRERAP